MQPSCIHQWRASRLHAALASICMLGGAAIVAGVTTGDQPGKAQVSTSPDAPSPETPRTPGSAQIPAPGPLPGLSAASAVRWNQPIEIHAESHPVRWNGGEYRLLGFSKATLTLDEGGRLAASLRGTVITFDNVDYQVSAAVFDAAGSLLGTARATCHVDREWLGHVLMMQRDMDLDFGASRAYPRAAWVTVAINECDVLTPDQWRKAG